MLDSAICAAMIERLNALGLTGDPTIEEFDGDDRALNRDAVFPHVAVDASTCDFGENEEAGNPVTVWETWTIEVIVSTADQPGHEKAAHAQGLAMLAELRAGLNGFELFDEDRVLTLQSQRLTFAAAQIFEWTQIYTLKALESAPKPE